MVHAKLRADGPVNGSAVASRKFLRLMATSRESDRREGICFRQGRAKFELAGAGHEAIAAVAYALAENDFLYPYYRDRALMLARGASVYQLALGFFAKAESSSSGRQLANHYSDARLLAMSCASPTAMQCLPAAGTAWFCKCEGAGQATVCCIGDAAVRQGEFYEALAFALQELLPLVFVVEDNGYGISTPSAPMNPYSFGALSWSHARRLDGRNPEIVFKAAQQALDRARNGGGPSVLWLDVDRLYPHSSSDDHRIYRPAEELAAIEGRDPIIQLRDKLVASGELTMAAWEEELRAVASFVDQQYQLAEASADPSPDCLQLTVFSGAPLTAAASQLTPGRDWTMVEALNTTLRDLLAFDPRVLLFGEDIEDPKGGVFGLTKGLSSQFPGRVKNSPLAEATIAGIACGLAVCGMKPVFELQFIDFAAPAFSQIVNQIATLRWRTSGAWKCPLVLLAPCGAYLPAGGPWHSQTNEGWFAHAPGLRIAEPSTPDDAAALLRAAVIGDDPFLLLLPKHLFRRRSSQLSERAVRLGEAKVRRAGSDLTVISWGNCVELALTAATAVQRKGISVEVIDLRSLVPCDWKTLRASISKTGRVVVVQEDNRTCSFGQALVAEIASRSELWNLLAARPRLVTREDVHVGFNPILEAAVLPSVDDLVEAIEGAFSD